MQAHLSCWGAEVKPQVRHIIGLTKGCPGEEVAHYPGPRGPSSVRWPCGQPFRVPAVHQGEGVAAQGSVSL